MDPDRFAPRSKHARRGVECRPFIHQNLKNNKLFKIETLMPF